MNILRFNHTEPISLAEFADSYGLTLEVHERSLEEQYKHILPPFYAFFQNTWLRVWGTYVFGVGRMEEDAIKDYCQIISESKLIVGREDVSILVPKLYYKL